ncbi:MAG: FMN-binding protein [Pirellulaceae bacterium]|nr:FMN-binding protein [Pirellulaceae bacterium]
MPLRGLLVVLTLVCGSSVFAVDLVEFLSGAKVSGTVKEIRKTAKEFDFQATIGTRTSVRTYPFSKVHAVTLDGKRFVLTPKSAAPVSAGLDPSQVVQRSRAEIQRLIETQGSQMPDWFASTELDYPKTLDLSWPLKPPQKGWNNKVNMGQYIWDIIHPNPSRWQSGIRLVHHCMSLHEGNRTLLTRDQKTLGRMFFELMQDYPRAAYWYQKARVDKSEPASVNLAECYWRMGNQQLAVQQVTTRTYLGGAAVKTVKLFGDMGMTDKAVSLANQMTNSGSSNQAFLAAGDALRQAGRLDEAITYYEKVIHGDGYRNKEYEKRFVARASESVQSIRLFDKTDPSQVPDGTHHASSTGYNGALKVAVEVAGGEIVSVKVVDHREKQFYSALTDTEANILQAQSVRGIDGTSGATITSQAIINATAKALAEASK